jgi:DNA adenine methylase
VFNVPIGRYRNPKILNSENLWAVSYALQEASLECRSFQHVLQEAKPGDFVYFDPPYEPLNKTSQFTDYSKDGFNAGDQRLLAAVFEELTRRKVPCMLSNSTGPLIAELYGDLSNRYKRISIDRVIARRSINSKATNRAPIEEIVVRNY